MPLSAATLYALQKAGAAVYQADQHVKEAVKEHAQRISAAFWKPRSCTPTAW